LSVQLAQTINANSKLRFTVLLPAKGKTKICKCLMYNNLTGVQNQQAEVARFRTNLKERHLRRQMLAHKRVPAFSISP
jgi:hypothetical protein